MDTSDKQAVPSSQGLELATLGGGCFWCLEPVFEELKGVKKVVAGYAGGHVPNPSYRLICTGTTGHAEVVQVTFDPQVITFRQLLEVFFTIHDPTTPNRQGADVGPQYRSIVLYHTEKQRETAEQVIEDVEKQEIWGAPLVTEIEPLTTFFEAEEYHQGYYKKNPFQGYCQVVIAPKVAKFRKKYQDQLKPA